MGISVALEMSSKKKKNIWDSKRINIDSVEWYKLNYDTYNCVCYNCYKKHTLKIIF